MLKKADQDCSHGSTGPAFREPKSLDVSKAIDKQRDDRVEVLRGERRDIPATDAAQQWQGFGTALKPAWEPIILARKPFRGNVAANVLEHGTGALNIDGCRIAGEHVRTTRTTALGMMNDDGWQPQPAVFESHAAGRWPANVVLDEAAAAELDKQSGTRASGKMRAGVQRTNRDGWAGPMPAETGAETYGDQGGASRFFYTAKAAQHERPSVDGVQHPTVKPLSVVRWLARLITPPGGLILDPFAGTGTTAEAALPDVENCVRQPYDVMHRTDEVHPAPRGQSTWWRCRKVNQRTTDMSEQRPDRLPPRKNGRPATWRRRSRWQR